MSTEIVSHIAIVGSRNYPDLSLVERFVESLPLLLKSDHITIVSGGARGVDQAAENAAAKAGLAVEIFLPDWEEHGRRAGILRNYDIVLSSDRVVGFWDCSSRGTAHTLRTAKQAKKLWKVFDSSGLELDIDKIAF